MPTETVSVTFIGASLCVMKKHPTSLCRSVVILAR